MLDSLKLDYTEATLELLKEAFNKIVLIDHFMKQKQNGEFIFL
ncbi:PF07601 family protein [Leptospira interrogans str. HAI1594]|nr:PF07601 family protein [Leptospira interrogans str. HAI1594]QIP65409.1 hypothetical protein LICSK_15775 [Leptospira interrogans serovar Copenhageni]SIQ74258.1 hypothetical protein SAMN05421689_12217 [Leptospira interrogans]